MFEKLARPLYILSDLRGAVQNVAGAQKLFGIPLKKDEASLSGPDAEARSMRDSFSRCVVPLSNAEARERYVNKLKQIRFGRLLEDLDSFAVYLGYKHTGMIRDGDGITNVKRANFSVVTALVDQIIKVRIVDPQKDLFMRGYVSWVGRSSMEITIDVTQEEENHSNHSILSTITPREIRRRKILTAHFVMVAIDLFTRKSISVTPLAVPGTEEEKAIIEMGKANKNRRQEVSDQSLFKKAPADLESDMIHGMYLSTLDANKQSFQQRVKPSSDVWMHETSMKGLVVCHPENRNIYGKIFGGFLMRSAYELAWAQAWTFCKSLPQCAAVDDIIFRRPVQVGALLYLHQSIGYTENNLIQSRVTASVTAADDPTKIELSNVFHFTFRRPTLPGQPALPRIFPRSYGESMLYLDSRRRLMNAKRCLKAMGSEL